MLDNVLRYRPPPLGAKNSTQNSFSKYLADPEHSRPG